jgi:hypothetical protein
VAWLRDATQRRAADRARREAERRLLAVGDQPNVALVAADADGRVTLATGGALAALGLDEAAEGDRLLDAGAHLPRSSTAGGAPAPARRPPGASSTPASCSACATRPWPARTAAWRAPCPSSPTSPSSAPTTRAPPSSRSATS